MTTAINWSDIFQTSFFIQALMGSLLAGIICGTLGPFVVWRRLGLVGEALSHAGLTGAALALVLGVPIALILVPFTILLSQGLSFLEEKKVGDVDASLAVFFSGFLALGVLILSMTGQGSREIVHMLLGDILLVSKVDLVILAVTAVFVTLYLVYFRHTLILMMLQPDLAKIEGLPVRAHSYLLMAMIGLTVATCLKIMGVILLTALFMVPPLVAKNFSSTLRGQKILSLLLAIGISVCGTLISFQMDLPTGPTVATLGLVCFLLGSLKAMIRSPA